ncbi:DNA-binding response regulator [Brevundimonas sp. GW460-12-10-14-LB2]|uniref:response regulator n=1 Tax=Brevundimonas sp. GW460-12-10-14-LB2 TaxID=1827469 RepID=UPI0007BCD188|nr:response regulator [Brevundimonas sp. GW460-12-10-14-LB2]ANC55200.1 DNA-binding response regulator [Brevundimonas sp. GW460-12-10-14-LB2]MEA3472874.1 response regulator [Pseudomonadota bacterium]
MSSLILIADDAAEGVEIMDAALRRDGFRTVVAADGQQAADLHASLKPDLALLSVRLPVRDGWDVLGELRRRGETPVIMIGDRDEATDKLQALRIGADDYIAKPFKPAEVTASIQTILRRSSGGGRTAKTLHVGPLEVQLENYLAAILTPSGKCRLDLTLTEFRILAHMARTPLRVFSRSEIMQACFPNQAVLERTIDSHVSHLRRKLDAADAAGLLTNVRGVGYRLEAEV